MLVLLFPVVDGLVWFTRLFTSWVQGVEVA